MQAMTHPESLTKRRNGLIRHKRHAGYTLIELMIVLVMAAILSTIVAPSFYEPLMRAKRQTALEDTLGMLRSVRGEATARASTAVACASADQTTCSGANNWEKGYLVFMDNGFGGGTAGNLSRDPNEPLVKINEGAPNGVTIRAANFTDLTKVAFTAQGTAFERGTFQICDKDGANHARAVILNRSGQPRLATDEDADGPVNTDAGSGSNVVCP